MHSIVRITSLVLFCCICSAQSRTKVPVTIHVGDSSRFGYERPNLAFRIGAERFNENNWFYGAAYFNPTDKYVYGNVTQAGVSGEFFLKNHRGFFAGGGGNARNITFHDLGPGQNYWIAGPVISGGWMADNLRLYVSGRLWEYDKRYKVRGASWGMIYDIKGKVRTGFEQGFYGIQSRSSPIDFGKNFVWNGIVGYVF